MKSKTKLLIPLLLALLSLFSCGDKTHFTPDLIPVKIGDKWGFVNKKGKYKINPQFNDADYFFAGLARVKNSEGLYGFINKKGKYKIEPRFKYAQNFSEELACTVEEGDYIRYIDPKGKVIIELKTAEFVGNFHQGLAKIKLDNKWGFINKKGEQCIAPQFVDAMDFTNNLAAVQLKLDNGEKLWGYIDREGKMVINPQFREAFPFSENMATFSLDGKEFGYINTKGRYIINPQFKVAYPFSNGLAVIKQGGDYGMINKKGEMVINPQFDEIGTSNDGKRILIKQNKRYGYIDKKGKYCIIPQFNEALPFLGDFAIVSKSGKIGLINKSGKYLANPQFNDVTDHSIYSLFGPAYFFEHIESDFFNMKLFLNKIFIDNKFIGIDTQMLSNTLLNQFELDAGNLKKKSLELSENLALEKLFNTKDVRFREATINFRKDAYKAIPNYVTYTDYWGNSKRKITDYSKKYFDHIWMKGLSAKITLRHKGEGKADLLTKELISRLEAAYNIESILNPKEEIYHLFSADSDVYIFIQHFNSTIKMNISYDHKNNVRKRAKMENY